jgi:hypothetical protein
MLTSLDFQSLTNEVKGAAPTLWEVLLEQHTVLNKKNGIFTKILAWSVASLCPQTIYGS